MPRKQTRNAQGGGTIRLRSDGRWEARYTTGRDPGTGKQIQKNQYMEKRRQRCVRNFSKLVLLSMKAHMWNLQS